MGDARLCELRSQMTAAIAGKPALTTLGYCKQ